MPRNLGSGVIVTNYADSKPLTQEQYRKIMALLDHVPHIVRAPYRAWLSDDPEHNLDTDNPYIEFRIAYLGETDPISWSPEAYFALKDEYYSVHAGSKTYYFRDTE
jgi:hypothetical protein